MARPAIAVAELKHWFRYATMDEERGVAIFEGAALSELITTKCELLNKLYCIYTYNCSSNSDSDIETIATATAIATAQSIIIIPMVIAIARAGVGDRASMITCLTRRPSPHRAEGSVS